MGYYVIIEKVEFDIEGMICVVCVNWIEKWFNKIEGVINVFVNFVLEIVIIEYNLKEMFVIDLKEVVDKLGYKF